MKKNYCIAFLDKKEKDINILESKSGLTNIHTKKQVSMIKNHTVDQPTTSWGRANKTLTATRHLEYSYSEATSSLFPIKTIANIMTRKRERDICFALISTWCIVTVSILWLFLTMACVGLHCMIVVFPDHIHLLFDKTWRWVFIFDKCVSDQNSWVYKNPDSKRYVAQ